MQDQVRPGHLLQRRLERFHEVVRKLPNETHRVREGGLPTPRQRDPPDGRIQRGEGLVGYQDAGVGKGVHEGGLAGVRVAGQRDLRDPRSLPARSFHLPALGQVRDLSP